MTTRMGIEGSAGVWRLRHNPAQRRRSRAGWRGKGRHEIRAERMRKASVAVWSYCLMPNHGHLILCPENEGGLALALGAAHRRWANFVNARGRWRGHLFDGRFASVAMDEAHLIAAVR